MFSILNLVFLYSFFFPPLLYPHHFDVIRLRALDCYEAQRIRLSRGHSADQPDS